MNKALKQHRKLKITLDVLAYSFIWIPLLCIIWVFWIADASGHISSSSPEEMPIQVKILLIDFFPLVFGLIWLHLRYWEIALKYYFGRLIFFLIVYAPMLILIVTKPVLLALHSIN